MKKLLLISCTIFLLGCTEGVKDQVRILWLGSSSTYVHDLPLQTIRWLNDYGEWNSTAELTGKSGTGFHEYMRIGFQAQYGLDSSQTLLEKIASENYDYVVIQQITYFMADADSAEISDATKILCEAIREAGGEPVFYEMGWRLPKMNDVGRDMILDEAVENQVDMYAPCSRAWKQVRDERPDLELHNLPDSDHPGTLGTYLNLCCFYAAFTGTSPVGLPADIEFWPRFGAFDEDIASRKLETASLDDYHEVMPQWMKRISIMATHTEIDASTAAYLQETAWNNWIQVSEKLK